MNARVVKLNLDHKYKTTQVTIVLERDSGWTSAIEPSSHDLPDDFAKALRIWLDARAT